jgi:hypothetical protein
MKGDELRNRQRARARNLPRLHWALSAPAAPRRLALVRLRRLEAAPWAGRPRPRPPPRPACWYAGVVRRAHNQTAGPL